MNPPTASVVLLNWNSGSFGVEAARSVRAQSVPCELIVVDNASSDDSLARIVEGAAPDRVIRHATNLGFGAGMNSGIAAAAAPLVLPLNCDVMLAPDYVERAALRFADDPSLAVLGGAVRWVDTLPSPVPESVAEPDEGPMDVTLTMRTARRSPAVAGPASKVTGACPVTRVAAVNDVIATFGVGPYDPVFDTYGEDVDFAVKLARLGWRIDYEPAMRAVHARSFSSARRLADKRGRLRRNVIRGRWIGIVRHVPSRQLPVALSVALAEDLGLMAVQLARRDVAIVTDTLSAWRFVFARRSKELGFRRRHAATRASVPPLRRPRLPMLAAVRPARR